MQLHDTGNRCVERGCRAGLQGGDAGRGCRAGMQGGDEGRECKAGLPERECRAGLQSRSWMQGGDGRAGMQGGDAGRGCRAGLQGWDAGRGCRAGMQAGDAEWGMQGGDAEWGCRTENPKMQSETWRAIREFLRRFDYTSPVRHVHTRPGYDSEGPRTTQVGPRNTSETHY